MNAIETVNDFAVAVRGDGQFLILNPPRGGITREQALRLAAYIIVMANGEVESPTIEDVMNAIMSV